MICFDYDFFQNVIAKCSYLVLNLFLNSIRVIDKPKSKCVFQNASFHLLCLLFVLLPFLQGICPYCRGKGVTNIPTYSWFLLQFWPSHGIAWRMLHYIWKFKVRRTVQDRLFRKSNTDAHYAKAVYKFLKELAAKNGQNVSFFSADAKCKVPLGKHGYVIATETGEKKVIVVTNEKFIVADHDLGRLSFIPEAYLLPSYLSYPMPKVLMK